MTTTFSIFKSELERSRSPPSPGLTEANGEVR